MLTIEERDVVVAAMRKYPAGVCKGSWGSSRTFFEFVDVDLTIGKDVREIESLDRSSLLEYG